MATLAFTPIIVDQEESGMGVYKQPGVAVKDGGVLAPTATGYAPVAAATQGNNLVISLMNQATTETRKLAVQPVDYSMMLYVNLSGVSTAANTAPGFKCALGFDATTGNYFANSAVTATPFFEVVEFVPSDQNGVLGDTNCRVRARPTPLV